MSKFPFRAAILAASFITSSAYAQSNICECDPNDPANVGAGDLRIVSRTTQGVQTDTHASQSTISGDGRIVAFKSRSAILAGTKRQPLHQIYAKNVVTGELTLVTTAMDGGPADSNSEYPIPSPDGRYVAFLSFADNLAPGSEAKSKQLFVADLETGEIQLISKSPDGEPANHHVRREYSWSPDSTKLVFAAQASNLDPRDTSGDLDLFVADVDGSALYSPTTWLEARSRVFLDAVFVSDSKIAFRSNNFEDFGFGDINGRSQIIVYDLIMGKATIASQNSNGDWADGDNFSPSFSADGTKMVWISESETLVDGVPNAKKRVYHRNLTTGVTQLASISEVGDLPTWDILLASISPDGTMVAYSGYMDDQIPGLTRSSWDVVIKHMATGALEQVTRNLDGTQNAQRSYSGRFTWSAESTQLVFSSRVPNLVIDDANRTDEDVFLYTVTGGICQ